MAGTAKMKYGQGAVYGSLAYDFNHPELYREEYSATPSRTAAPRTQTKTTTRVHTRARQVVHSKQSIAPLSIVGLMVAGFLFVISLFIAPSAAKQGGVNRLNIK